jgi:CBS domain containing-hemolysin-like protein
VSLILAVVSAMLVVLAGGITAGGTAIFALGPSRVRTLVDEGFAGAGALARLEGRLELRTALALLATVLRLSAMGLGTAGAAAMGGLTGALVALPLLILGVLLVGREVPLGLAARFPVRVALAAAPLLVPLDGPLRLVLGPWVRLGDWVAGRAVEEPEQPDERVVQDMTRLGREEGIVDVEENQLVERAFRLDELAAWDVMTPRVDVFSWSDELTLTDIMDELPSVPYSRVPLYHGSVDEITGILYVREAYETYVSGNVDLPLNRVAKEPLFVPGSLSLSHLLRAFQTRRIHMAVVADEFGGTDGIVTLEDVLEELVGEIVDETDEAQEPALKISGDDLIADASVDLREVNHAFGTTLPQEEHRSLNGLILEELGRVPEAGETLDLLGVHIEILEATDTHVVRARLRKLTPLELDGEEQPMERNA